MSSPGRLVRGVLTWPVSSQQGSRRNAMVASTALTRRRRELEEVEAFLAARNGPSPVPREPPRSRRGVI
jgi:hypothetical protein